MKIRLPTIIAGILAIAASMPLNVHTEDQQKPPLTSHQWMEDNANASAQDSTDMSYGGTPDTSSASGDQRARQCTPRPFCDVYFGN